MQQHIRKAECEKANLQTCTNVSSQKCNFIEATVLATLAQAVASRGSSAYYRGPSHARSSDDLAGAQREM